MGFFDSLGHALKVFAGSAAESAQSVAGVLAAPYGLVADLGHMAFDDKDDDLGDVMRAVGKRAGDLVDPLTNQGTVSGYTFGKTMQGLGWAYKQGVDRPLGTALTELQHASTPGNFGSLFSGEDWAKAYEISDRQSFGQAAVFGLQNTAKDDPFAAKTTPFAESELVKQHPTFAASTALGVDLTASWFLDPGVAVIGNAGRVARASQLGKVKATERADFYKKLTDPSPNGIMSRDWAGRTDKWFGFIKGDNPLKRPLHEDEIWHSSIELRRNANGRGLAREMARAARLPEGEGDNAMRRILAVGVGDISQIQRLRAESDNAAAIADALENMADGSTLKLAKQALSKDARYDPALNRAFDEQIANLDANGDVTNFVKRWKSQIKGQQDELAGLTDIENKIDFVPGVHRGPTSSTRPLKRENSQRLVADKALKELPELGLQRARDYAHRESFTSVFQSSINHVPLMVAHVPGLALSPYRAATNFVDGLRTKHFLGAASLDDWNGSINQLDAMLRHAEVADDVRHAALSVAYKARTEAEKRAALEHVEHTAVQGVADYISRKHGLDVSREWVKAHVIEGQGTRAADLGRLTGGRVYATSGAPAEVVAAEKAKAIARLQKQADDVAGGPGLGTIPQGELDKLDEIRLRSDQILDDTGLPLALPLVESQLANRIPLVDIARVKNLANDAAWVERFKRYGDAWEDERKALAGLNYALKSGQVRMSRMVEKQIRNHRATMDFLQDAASLLNRGWKFGVLMRLGYPVRVLMDDHPRIATQMHYSTFALGNGAEGVSNKWYNSRLNFRDGRYRAASDAFKADQAEYDRILSAHLGLDALPSEKDWAAAKDTYKALRKGELGDADRAGAEALLSRVDPAGRLREHMDRVDEANNLVRSVSGHRNAIARWRKQIEDADTKHSLGLVHDVDVPGLRKKIADTEALIAHKEAAREATLAQLGEHSPDELMSGLRDLDKRLRSGKAGYLGEKRKLGERGVRVDENTVFPGAFDGPGAGYRGPVSSSDSIVAHFDDMEGNGVRLASSGSHRTVQPGEHGYTYIWSQVLNHQFQHSPELMAFVKGKVSTPEEFAEWLAKPEQRHIRERVGHYAADPIGWGHRLQQVYQDYLPTTALREAVAKGRVGPKDIERMVPEHLRPPVHTDLADVNSGRHTAVRMVANGMNNTMGWLATAPIDTLSRQPFFNSMYKRHLAEITATHKAAGVARFGPEEIDKIARQARQKALNDLKQLLWDVSAHSHTAHVMRFISPFFSAHQEAMMRWWRIATDDPAVVRKFQLFFDAPRKAGLTYDTETGELVPPGAAPSPSHRVMIAFPGGLNSGANKWLKKVGGDRLWSVNENGFNLILQSGVFNPGTGPLVTVPMESLLQHYGSPELEKVARTLNPYPLDSPASGFYPAWYRRMKAITEGEGNREFNARFAVNWADALTEFRQENGGAVPTEHEHDELMRKAMGRTYSDLWIMMGSNLTSPLPVRPESKYSVVQHGLSNIMSQMRAGGHDWEWARDQFYARYGKIYDALLTSTGDNVAGLTSSWGDVDALRKHRSLLNKIDPRLTQMVTGAEVAGMPEAERQFTATARTILAKTKAAPGSSETYFGTKSPDEMSVRSMVSQGWDQYRQMTNWLTLQAKAQGLASYEDSKALMAAKSAGVAYLKRSNFAWRDDFDSYTFGGDYAHRLEDMQQIVSDKRLRSDATRRDVYWLSQYLQVREQVSSLLDQRKSAGGSGDISAKSNQDLLTMFGTAVRYMRDQNTQFDDYMYHGVIEKDPYLAPLPDEEKE